MTTKRKRVTTLVEQHRPLRSPRRLRGFTQNKTTESLAKRLHRTILTMKQIQPLADSESPLFSLPHEIRDQIYDHIWEKTRKIRQWYKQKQSIVTYDLDSTAEETLPVEKATWLLTNKQMLHEGMQQLHQKSEWHFKGSYGETKPQYCVLPLITPTQARIHHIAVSSIQPLHYDNERRIYSLKSSTCADIGESALSTSATSPVDAVYINMTRAVAEPRSVNTALNFNFDLAGFDRLAAHTSMRKFQVRVAYIPQTPDTVAAQWNTPTPHELQRVGRLLVEGGVESWDVVETRPSEGYDDGAVCWVYTIEKS